MINENALVDSIQKIFKVLGQIQDDIKIIKSDIGNLNDEVTEIKEELKGVSKRIDETNDRIDLIGKQLANLDEDAPSGEDFRTLEKRVTKIEQSVVFA